MLQPSLALRSSALLLTTLFAAPALATNVIFTTPLGEFEVELFDEEAPNTVANFLKYVQDGDYVNSFVHRSIDDFVIQGGGFVFENQQVVQVPVDAPIANEFGRSNTRGTIAMAKNPGNPDSATSQWFINLVDNSATLDSENGGYTVFGRVVEADMAVVDAIAALETWFANTTFTDLPLIDYSGSGAVAEQHIVFAEPRLAGSSGFIINAGLSGAWFNPATPGQGWLLDVIDTGERREIFVAWFTFDTQAPGNGETDGFGSTSHRWFTASGPFDGDTAQLTIALTSGGIFNDPQMTTSQTVGTMTIRFIDCTNAELSFDFDDPDVPDDTVTIARLSPDAFCGAMTR